MIDLSTVKQVCEIAPKTSTSEIPSFKTHEVGRGSIGETGRPFSPLAREIPTFKSPNEISSVSFEKNIDGIKIEKGDLYSVQNGEGRTECEKEIGLEVPYKGIPKSDGCWTGEPGNSTWNPTPDIPPGRYNPDNKTWGQILKENGIEGVPFKDGEPDFSEITEGSVEIDDYTDNRADNFAQADEELASNWNEEQKDGKSWTPDDVDQYRKDNKLTWHERSDMKTMDLVSSEVHGNIPHTGGIAAIKDANNSNTGVA